MKTLLCALLLFAPSLAWSCPDHKARIFVEVTFGSNGNINDDSYQWDDGGGTGMFFSLGYQGKQVKWLYGDPLPIAVYKHGSQIDVGPPANDEDESSVDHFGLGLRWEWDL